MANRLNLDKRPIEKAILYTLIGGALILSPSMGSKVVLAMIKYYLRKWWEEGGPYIPPEKDPNQVRESLYRLKRCEYVIWKYDHKENVVKLELTKKGKKMFEKQNLFDLKITPPKEWDGRWRFVLFDIPEKSKSFRESFRERLKNLEFLQFQKSVWLYPYECEKEIRFISEYLGITPFVICFTAAVDNDGILRKYFLGQGVLLKQHTRSKSKVMER